MAGSMEQPGLLFVEGDDDMHMITHLLMRHGITWDLKAPAYPFPEVKPTGGVERLLAGIETAVEASTGRSIGFVLDANTPIASRWQAVRDRLRNAEIQAPDEA